MQQEGSGGLGSGPPHTLNEPCGMGRVEEPRQGLCCSRLLVSGDSGAGGISLSWAVSLQR